MSIIYTHELTVGLKAAAQTAKDLAGPWMLVSSTTEKDGNTSNDGGTR